MNCTQIHELMPDLAAGVSTTAEARDHLASCGTCSSELDEFRRTLALLDEWKAPEPSPYFDVRLHARLREEARTRHAGFMQWFRKPALVISLMVLMVAGITLYPHNHVNVKNNPVAAAQPGTAVGDLQALDKNHDLYSDFDLLDDLQVQQNVTANP